DGPRVPPALHAIARARTQRQAAIGAELSLEIDGRVLTCLVNAVILPADDDARGDRVIAVFHDITEAARLEREVARQSARLEAVVHLVDEGIFVVNDEARLVFVNETGRRMLDCSEGMSLEERVRRLPLFDSEGRLLPGSSYPSSRGLAGEAVTGLAVSFDHPLGGRRHLRANAHPLRRPDGAIEAVFLPLQDGDDPEPVPGRSRLSAPAA